MDKSCRRILFCNFCQNNKGNLSTSVLAYTGGLVSVLLNPPIEQFYKLTPGSTSHMAIAKSQLQFFPPAAIPAKILISLLLFMFFLAAFFFSHHLPSKAAHLINQNQVLTSTASKGIFDTALYSNDLTGHVFVIIQLPKTLAVNLLMNLDLYVPVPESKKLKKIPNRYFVQFLRENSASISLRTDPENRLLLLDKGRSLKKNFLDV